MATAGEDVALRVCIISQEFPPHTNWGGVGVYNGVLARQLALRGHEVTVVSRRHPGAPADESPATGLRVLRVGLPIHCKRLVGRTLDRALHARSVAAAVRVLDASLPFDVFETTEANFEGEGLLGDARFRGRMVIQCNGSNAFGQAAGGVLGLLHRLDWRWSFQREQRALALVPHVIVTSEATSGVLLGQGVDPGKIHLIYQGIDLARFHPPTGRAAPRPLHVGFAGRLEMRKGIDFLWRVIEAVGPGAGIHFHLKGALHPTSAADSRARLARYAAWVTHHAPGSHEEMPEFYRGLDVLLQPSRFENFGLVYAEAMATQLLVFAGVGGSAREVVRDGETGFLVDPSGSVERVVLMLARLALDRTAFADLRCAARSDVERRFSLAACIDAKLALYRAIGR